MQTIVPGTFKDGEIRLREQPPGVTEAEVLVTFLDTPAPKADEPTFRISEATGFSVLCLPPATCTSMKCCAGAARRLSPAARSALTPMTPNPN